MSIFYYLTNYRFIVLLITIGCFFYGCRKEIKFEESIVNSSGTVDPNKPVLEPWLDMDLGDITLVSKIESDGQYLYFSGVQSGTRKMFKMNELGEITALYSVNTYIPSGIGEVSHLSFQAPFLYACYSGFATQTIKIFNSNGIQQEIDFDLNNIPDKRINSILDLDTSYCIVGNFSASASNVPSAPWVVFLNKTTGVCSSKAGISKEPLDATVFNNQVLISGYGLAGLNWNSSADSYSGSPMAKFNGTIWTLLGNSAGQIWKDNYRIPPKFTSIKPFNSKLYCSGSLESQVVLGVYGGAAFVESGFFKSSIDSYLTRGILKEYNNELYAFGTLTLKASEIKTVQHLNNGTWVSIGALGEVPDDFAVLNSFAYAVVGGTIKKYPL